AMLPGVLIAYGASGAGPPMHPTALFPSAGGRLACRPLAREGPTTGGFPDCGDRSGHGVVPPVLPYPPLVISPAMSTWLPWTSTCWTITVCCPPVRNFWSVDMPSMHTLIRRVAVVASRQASTTWAPSAGRFGVQAGGSA